MSFSSLVHDTVSLPRNRKRTPVLTCPRHSEAAPIPPRLVNSPHLFSPNSVFQRKSSIPRWPSRENDDWLRDMVPVDASLASGPDAKSEGSDDSSTPSPTSSDSSHCFLLFPPSPMLRPRSTSPTPGKLALWGPGVGQSPHT